APTSIYVYKQTVVALTAGRFSEFICVVNYRPPVF
ncbi:MAG: hypothetical protein ACI861_002040, partial [Paracoccaceae bacterium]